MFAANAEVAGKRMPGTLRFGVNAANGRRADFSPQQRPNGRRLPNAKAALLMKIAAD